MLTIRHDVASSFYRSPGGPVPCDTTVTFRASVTGDAPESVRLFYLYGLEEFAEGYAVMDREGEGDGSVHYSARLRLNGEPGLFYYWFEARLGDGRYRWGYPDPSRSGTRCQTLDHSPAFHTDGSSPIPAFQVTVYDGGFKTPDWAKGAVLYQIFPDRFSRGSGFDREKALALMRRPERIWHETWDEDVDYRGRVPGGYEACDFFGGTLKGITERLPYLVSLGVSVLYLNPVFEARSNHRYDTADYLAVDPLLGTEDDLVALFRQAGALGIRVILDGVFSHTGADSRYFNRYGRYTEAGAWQEFQEGQPSRYTSWYRFTRKDPADCDKLESGGEALPYDCWWDFPSLPNVNEDDLTYRAFILGPDGVLAHWLRQGCSGFRLDVSDELPDSFLRHLRRRVKSERPDAYIVGEVWEEPTAKISYGHHRDFLFGLTHDAVMGYPFRQAVLAFLKNETRAEELASSFERMLSLTPPQALYTQMNLLGSHDTERVITALAGPPAPEGRKEQADLRLTADQRRRGERLVGLAALFQLAFPGVTALYYGDEIGMEGYKDPFNRRTFPQDAFNPDLNQGQALTRTLASLMRMKARTPVLKTGFFAITHAGGDLLIMRRYKDRKARDAFGQVIEGPEEVIVAVNRGSGAERIPGRPDWPRIEAMGGSVFVDGRLAFAF